MWTYARVVALFSIKFAVFDIDGDAMTRGEVGVASGVESRELKEVLDGESDKEVIEAGDRKMSGLGTFFRIMRGGGAGKSDKGKSGFDDPSSSPGRVESNK